MFCNLETERLLLCNIANEDADFFYQEFSNDDINEYLYDAEPVSTREEAEEWIRFFTQPEPRDSHRWIIALRETNEKIGTCGFHCWDSERGITEMGYDLQPAHWRNGFMTEALQAILAFAREQMKVNVVVAHIAENNQASIGTVKKLGFKKTDETYYEEFHGEKYLHYVYQLTF